MPPDMLVRRVVVEAPGIRITVLDSESVSSIDPRRAFNTSHSKGSKWPLPRLGAGARLLLNRRAQLSRKSEV